MAHFAFKYSPICNGRDRFLRLVGPTRNFHILYVLSDELVTLDLMHLRARLAGFEEKNYFFRVPFRFDIFDNPFPHSMSRFGSSLFSPYCRSVGFEPFSRIFVSFLLSPWVSFPLPPSLPLSHILLAAHLLCRATSFSPSLFRFLLCQTGSRIKKWSLTIQGIRAQNFYSFLAIVIVS